MNAILHVAGNPASCFGAFLKRSLNNSRHVHGAVPRSDIWPCPPPLWSWTAAQRLSPRRRHRRSFLQLKARTLQYVVISLNWLTLGHARSPPDYCVAGAPISDAQHAVLERLEEMIHYFLSAPCVALKDLGRAGEKLANLLKVSFLVPSHNSCSFEDVESFLKVIQSDLDSYGRDETRAAPTSADSAASAQPCGDANACDNASESATGYKVELATSPAKEVVADRIKWKLGPTFNPLPYLSDPIVKDAYLNPEVLRKPKQDWPPRPRARVRCKKSELLKLAEKWDSLGACQLIPVSEIGIDEAVGLFAVPKDPDYDRLIINPTVINSRMYTVNTFTKTIAPGHLIGMIRLLPDEDLRISSDDLREFYYTFRVSISRAARNAIGTPFFGWELSHLRCFDPQYIQDRVYICLSTLAMGDGLAVENAQQSHYNLLRQLGGCMDPKEVLAYRRAIPKGPFYELLTIDDHIGLQRVKKHVPLQLQDTRDKVVFKQAEEAYSTVGLTPHPGKRQRQVTHATVLGAEVDGLQGRVSAPRNRLVLLMFCTAVIIQKQQCTKKILQSIIGCWIHALLFRRCIFSVLDSVYHEGAHASPHDVFRLSSQTMNELRMLLLLGTLAQTNLRADVCPELFMMDASPAGGAICRASVGSEAVHHMWLHSEQRGYYTKLEQGPGIVLREKGFEHTDLFGAETQPVELSEALPESFAPLERPLTFTFDCIELFRGQGNWSSAHESQGLKAHPGLERSARGLQFGDLSDDGTFRKMISLAGSGCVREWHAAPPCWSFGTLRRPRLRSRDFPAGFDPQDSVTWSQTLLAIRTAFILCVAVLAGSFISCEQPGSSVMFYLECFKRLLALGCRITKFCFCGFGSGFNKPSKWLHNKPWLDELAGQCTCAYRNQHFVVQGTFTRQSIREFDRRCNPDCLTVYGRMPRVGEAVSSFSASYPTALCQAMANGSAASLSGRWSSSDNTGRAPVRPWHEDPDWVHDLCEGLEYRELFRYKFKRSGHINCLECRVYKSWLKHCAKKWVCCRLLGLLDSRVTLGAAAKGRSSSRALSHILKTSLGYVLGSELYPGGLHVRSAWNRADGPSRDGPVPPPTCKVPPWLEKLQGGDDSLFEVMIESARWTRPVGRWVRLLLLMAGDVEPNPGPERPCGPGKARGPGPERPCGPGKARGPGPERPCGPGKARGPGPERPCGPGKARGPLSMVVGLSQTTVARMDACLRMFEAWLKEEVGWTLSAALDSAQNANLSLRAYGRFCYASGKPRYHLVYAITAVQHLRPEFRLFLAGAWQVDKQWQLEEPGQCRAVLSAPVVRSIVALAFLWNWHCFGGLVVLGCAGMLHPNEFILLQRSDLIFPSDALETKPILYVHIKNPKTARFARRQHVRIDDPSVLQLAQLLFEHLPLEQRLFGASIAVFRRQWNACLDHLGIPRRQTEKGATPGTLRGSGATQLYLESEDLQKVAWRGRWARMRTVEHYVQEVAAQLFLHQLPSAAKSRIILLEQHVWTILQAQFPDFFRSLAKQELKDGKGGCGWKPVFMPKPP